MTEPAAPRAAVYARVSTAEQVHGLSLDIQQTRARSYAEAQGWTVVGIYVDQGVSGAKQSRPELDRLFAEVHRGTVDVVIVYKLDRLGRTMRTLTRLLADCDDRGIRVVSVSEAFDSLSANGRLMRNLLGSFAEFERERIRTRMLDGIEATVRAGGWPGGTAPFGWRVTKDANSSRRILELDPDEQRTLRKAVHLFVDEQMSIRAVVRHLNDHQLRPRGSFRTPPDQRRWTATGLRTCLRRCDHFAGTWTYRRSKPGRADLEDPPVAISIPPALTENELAALRLRLRQTSKPVAGLGREPAHLLTSRLSTPHRTTMYGNRARGRPSYYVCAAAASRVDGKRCDCRRINAEVLESLVWAELQALLTDRQRLRGIAESAIDSSRAAEAASVESSRTLARRVHQLERILGEELAKLLAAGGDAAAVQHATTKLRQRLDATKQRHQQALVWEAANRQTADRHQQILDLAAYAAERLDAPDFATRRRLIDLLDIRVQVTSWQTCATCNGKGKIPDPRGLPPTGRKRKPEDRMQAPICPACHGHRTMPSITITGVIPAPVADAESTVSFNLQAVAE